MTTDVDDACAQVRTRGFARLEGLYPPARLQRIDAAIDALYTELGRPPLHAPDPIWLRPHVEVAGPGLAIYQLLRFLPQQLAGELFTAEALAVLGGLLGETMHLELVGAVLGDEGRPFTEWETHLGGIDDERWRVAGKRPRLSSVQRVVHFLFLDDLDEDAPWWVLPRAVGDPIEPPASIHQLRWPGAQPLVCRAGDVLLLEQSVWHCVEPRTRPHVRPGMRRFVGAYFAGPEAATTMGRDDSLDALAERDDLPPTFRALLRHRPPRDDP